MIKYVRVIKVGWHSLVIRMQLLQLLENKGKLRVRNALSLYITESMQVMKQCLFLYIYFKAESVHYP